MSVLALLAGAAAVMALKSQREAEKAKLQATARMHESMKGELELIQQRADWALQLGRVDDFASADYPDQNDLTFYRIAALTGLGEPVADEIENIDRSELTEDHRMRLVALKVDRALIDGEVDKAKMLLREADQNESPGPEILICRGLLTSDLEFHQFQASFRVYFHRSLTNLGNIRRKPTPAEILSDTMLTLKAVQYSQRAEEYFSLDRGGDANTRVPPREPPNFSHRAKINPV